MFIITISSNSTNNAIIMIVLILLIVVSPRLIDQSIYRSINCLIVHVQSNVFHADIKSTPVDLWETSLLLIPPQKRKLFGGSIDRLVVQSINQKMHVPLVQSMDRTIDRKERNKNWGINGGKLV